MTLYVFFEVLTRLQRQIACFGRQPGAAFLSQCLKDALPEALPLPQPLPRVGGLPRAVPLEHPLCQHDFARKPDRLWNAGFRMSIQILPSFPPAATAPDPRRLLRFLRRTLKSL